MSHTATTRRELRDLDALKRACAMLSAEYLGCACHSLYDGKYEGTGVKLRGWAYPIVVGADGSIHYDDYGGHWGDVKDLDALQAEYNMAAAQMAAESLGWQWAREESSLIVFHPSGGTVSVSAAGIDANGFVGGLCHDAVAALQLPIGQVTLKSAACQVQAVGQVVV